MSDSSIPNLPSQGEALLITDELSSPADFLLYRSFTAHLKSAGKSAKCVILSVAGNLPKWKSVAAKSNINISQLITSGSLTFLDLSSTHFSSDHDALDISLRPVYDQVQDIISQGQNVLVIVDDLSSLEWIGTPGLEVARFTRALCALCRKLNASLILRHHITTPGELDDLRRLLIQLSTYHIDVFPLSSGRSGSVSGQVALHLGPGQTIADFRPIPRSRALLYHLTDTSSMFFERGTGAGVL